MTKWMKLLAALFAVSLVAAACGGTDAVSDAAEGAADAVAGAGDDAVAEAQAAAEAAKAEAEAAKAEADEAKADLAAAQAADGDDDAPAAREFEGQVVRVTGPERSADEWNAIETAMEPFEEETGLQVIYTGSADWEQEINVQISAGNPPDLSIFPQPGKLADFARAGSVLPLPDDVNSSVSSNWSDAQMAFGNVDGTQVGVPVKSDLKSIVWYKPSVFEAGGYEVPTSWDDLKTLTNTMIADGNTPWCVGIESIPSTHFASKPAEDLAADNCAMVRQASFFAGFLPDGASDDMGWFYFPAVEEGTMPVLVAGNLTGAFVDSPAVWATMDYMGSAEYATARQTAQRANKDGGISGFNTANLGADRSLWSPFGAEFLEFMQSAETIRFDGSDLMPADVGAGEFWTQATAMVAGEASVADAAAKIDAAWPSE